MQYVHKVRALVGTIHIHEWPFLNVCMLITVLCDWIDVGALYEKKTYVGWNKLERLYEL